MTVASTLTAKQYTSTGVSTQFAFPNKIFAAADLVVTIFDLAGTAYPFVNFANATLGLTFSVQNVDVDTGCTVVLSGPFTLNWTIDIRSLVADTQSTSIKNQGQFLPELHEESFDRATRQIQDLLRLTYTFGIHGPDTETVPWPALPAPSLRKSYGLLFDAITGLPGLGFLSAQNVTLGLLVPLLNLQQTAAEATAGATVVNFFYPPLSVDRYATNTTPGTTSMTAAFQAAINVAKISGGVITWDATKLYLLDAPLNCTNAGQLNVPSYTFRGIGGSHDTGRASLIVNHSGHVFDCAGSYHIIFEDISLRTTGTPQTIFFLARNSSNGLGVSGPSAGWHRFLNVRIVAACTKAIYYNYGSEDGTLMGCDWTNNYTGSSPKVCVFSAFNVLALSSTFITIATLGQSTIDHQILGGQYHCQSHDGAADTFYLDGAESLKIYGPWVACHDNTAGGRSMMYTDTSNGASSFVKIFGFQGERGLQPSYGFYFGNTAATCTGWGIYDAYIPASTKGLFANANVILDSFHIKNFQEQSSLGIQSAGTVQNSVIDSATTLVAIVASNNNTLIGRSENWTIGSSSNDNWIDSGTTNKTWTPNTSGLTITGALTIFEKHCLIHGSMVTVQLSMSAATSIVCAAGVNISGLPVNCAFRSALVSVCNQTTHVTIGAGMVETGVTGIILPAINVGANVVITITATYFRA